MSAQNALWDMLSSGKKVIAVELDPPTDDTIAPFLQGVEQLRAAGADLITIADSPVGRPRADSSLLACKLKREMGAVVLPHITCRDRNEIATRALLLGLAIEGIHNVLLVTGDPVPKDQNGEVKSVFNFNARKLSQYVTALNHTVLHTPFCIFGALNVNAANFSAELRRAQEKEESGMAGFLTQPILSQKALDHLKLARQVLNGKLLAGVFPVVSHKNALFLNNEVSGVYVCPEIIQLYEGKNRQEGEALAERISAQVVRAALPYADGLYLMTPFQRVPLMTRILANSEMVMRAEGNP